MNKKKSIVFIGATGFPYGLAAIQKAILISKCLILKGNTVTAVCEQGIHNEKEYPDLKPVGTFQEINYVYTSGTPFRTGNFVKRNYLKVKGAVGVFFLLRKMKKNNNLDIVILSIRSFPAIFYFFLLSKLFGFKTVLNYVEYYSKIKKRKLQISRKLNDLFRDKYGLLFVDAVFPISEFLINHIKEVAPKKRYLKIPGLTDFNRYEGIDISEGDKYFLFCGDAAYRDVIEFIIDSFNILTDKSTYLYLVINGTEQNKSEVKNYINESAKKEKIKFFSKLPEKELFSLYKNAIGLLIPLRPTFQDIARFPHKTGEYMASGNPVISTQYGEIKYYFRDMENILLAKDYDINLFADKMQFVIDEPEIAQKIGIKGKEIGMRLFDYRYQAEEMDYFLDGLFNN
jgi:glycosyltransferase involved in cell wall biosynthesis